MLNVSERIATQKKWLKGVWTTQVARLLTDKEIAAYAGQSHPRGHNRIREG